MTSTVARPPVAPAVAASAHAGAGPAIVHGDVMHVRSRPVRNAFRYRAFCLRLPLSSLDTLPGLGIARNARAPIAFHDADHGPRDGSPLDAWMRALLARERVAADGEIVLYTFPRMLGYVFNPVSFWVCHDRAGGVRAVLCEVNNTFGESHAYLVARDDGAPIANGQALHARKAFHVSPFCETKGRYAFRFFASAGSWLARIDYHDVDADAPLLATSIGGRTEPLSPGAVARLLPRYRWFTLGVVAKIHWQALRLWWKRVPHFRKPAPPAIPLTRPVAPR